MGMNFALPPSELPTEDLVAEIETSAQHFVHPMKKQVQFVVRSTQY